MLFFPVLLFFAWVLLHRYGAASVLSGMACVLLITCGIYLMGAYPNTVYGLPVAAFLVFAGVLMGFAAVITAICSVDARRRME